MKTSGMFKTVLAVVAMAALSASVFANGKVLVHSYKKTNYALVSASLPISEAFNMTIKNSEGQTLYSAKVKNNAVAFQKLLDISQLEDGKYILNFSSPEASYVSHFVIRDNQLVLDKSNDAIDVESFSINSTYIKQSDNLIYVTYLNPALNSSSIEIFDRSGDSVYSAELPTTETFSGAYKIDELPKGQYLMVLTSGDKSQSYEFEK